MKKALKFTLLVCSSILVGLMILAVGEEIAARKDYSYSRLHEVRMREKIFSKGKTEVRLIGMIHVAKEEFYEQIKSKLPKDSSEVVTLIEGVGGGKNDDKIQYLDYKELSKEVGLASQTNYMNMFPQMVRADVSHDELSEELQENISTVDLLIGLVIKFHHNKISLAEVKKIVEEKKASFISLNSFVTTMSDESGEVIKRRNDVLWSKIKEYESTRRVIVVPWGSAHLADIEKRLVMDGYKEVDSRSYSAINLVSTLINNWSFIQSYIQIQSLLP